MCFIRKNVKVCNINCYSEAQLKYIHNIYMAKRIKPVGHALNKLLKPLALKNGFADARIFSNWASIVGQDFATQARPKSLNNKVLTVFVANSGYSVQIQHQATYLMERINCYFGYKAVHAVRVVQSGSWQEAAKKQRFIEPDQGAYTRAQAHVHAVRDEGLKASLLRLGALVETQYSKKVT